MSVAVIADSHLGGPGGPPGPLVDQLEALPEQGCHHLVLLGDIFHVWVGFSQFETPEMAPVLDAVAGLRARGLRVSYIEGNRDFFLDRGPWAGVFDEIATRLDVVLPSGRRVLAIHGDGLDDRDWQYRFWRWLSKSWPIRQAVRSLPTALAKRFVLGTEQRLAQTNFKHRTRIPEEVLKRFASGQVGYDQIVLGHFHEERRWQVEERDIWLLEAWFSSRRVEWLEAPE